MSGTAGLWCAGRIAGLRRRYRVAAARSAVARVTPELPRAYEAFRGSGQSGTPRQPFKGWDLWQLLERCRPKHIVELGSGTTSAVFALWAQRHAAAYDCFEHHAGWAGTTEQCLRASGLVPGASPVRVVAARTREDGAATGFVEPVPDDADFVYVDGPPCLLPSGVKVPNDDVTRLLDRGARPRAIVVDGRLETVDLIRAHPAMRDYLFEPGFAYALRRGLAVELLAGREHTLFLRTGS